MTSSSIKVICHRQKHVCLLRKDLKWFNNPFNTENTFRQLSYFPAIISSLKAARRDIYFPAHSIVNPSLLKTHWHPRESNKFSAVFAPCGSACVLLSDVLFEISSFELKANININFTRVLRLHCISDLVFSCVLTFPSSSLSTVLSHLTHDTSQEEPDRRGDTDWVWDWSSRPENMPPK